MQLLFGKRFFETVQCLNLLEAAKPSLQHGGKTKDIQLHCNIACYQVCMELQCIQCCNA